MDVFIDVFIDMLMSDYNYIKLQWGKAWGGTGVTLVEIRINVKWNQYRRYSSWGRDMIEIEVAKLFICTKTKKRGFVRYVQIKYT